MSRTTQMCIRDSHLHQPDIQLAAVQANGIHCALDAGHMAVVVCTPHINGFVKAAGGQLIVVVGDVGGKVGGDAVGADEDLVLGLLLGAVVASVSLKPFPILKRLTDFCPKLTSPNGIVSASLTFADIMVIYL